MSNFEYLLSPIDIIKGVGKKTLRSFNKKKIFTIFDLLWHLPVSKIETAEDTEIEDLQIGKNYNIKVKPIKYNFPRIRNLPNKVICEKNGVKIDCVFFNSYEGYIRKLLPLNEDVVINGKANNFRNKFQFVNPRLVKSNSSILIDDENKYSLTEGLTLNKYNQILNSVFQNLPDLDEWLPNEISNLFDNVSWKECVIKIHKEEITKIKDTKYFLVFSTLIIVPGVFLLNVLDSDLILIFIAILLFMNSSLSLSNRVVAIPNHQNSIIQLLTGSLNGFIIGLTSIYTMPFVFLLQSLKYNKEKTVQFMGLAFLLYSSMQFISFSYIKLISINTIVPSLIVTLPVIIGFLLGKKIRSFISEKLFKKLFYLMLLLMSGIILINAFL